jgi:outer membrane protein assembly factor BamE (lipoprotein component of BamABCDE complex)
MNFTLHSILLAVIVIATGGCTASQHRAAVTADDSDRVTVGTVQSEIVIGMDAASVAETLGSPNIVTSSERHQETWIYDKISTDVTYSRSSGAVVGMIFGSAAAGAGGGIASSGASSTSQRTLTVIIKFDEQHQVRDFSYHTSRF